MDVSTAISLLTINLIVLSIVIVIVIIATIVLVVRLNKIAKNVNETTNNVAKISEWTSPTKIIGEIASAINTVKNSK